MFVTKSKYDEMVEQRDQVKHLYIDRYEELHSKYEKVLKELNDLQKVMAYVNRLANNSIEGFGIEVINEHS